MCDQAQNQFNGDRRPTRLLLVSSDGHFANAFALAVEGRLQVSLVHISSLRAAAVMLEGGRKVDLMVVDGRIQSDVVEHVTLFAKDYPIMLILLLDETKLTLNFERLAVVERGDTESALSTIVYGLTVGF